MNDIIVYSVNGQLARCYACTFFYSMHVDNYSEDIPGEVATTATELHWYKDL